MEHFTTENWIDFVNQAVDTNEQELMERHLRQGCKRCNKTVSLWQRVRQSAASEANYSLLRAPSESPRQHLQGPGWRVKERERAAVSKFSSTVFCSRFSKELDRQVLAQGRCSIERTHFRSTFRWRPGLAAIGSWSPASSLTSAVLESSARAPTSFSPICGDRSCTPPPISLGSLVQRLRTAETYR